MKRLKRKRKHWFLADMVYLGIGIIFGVSAMYTIAYFLT